MKTQQDASPSQPETGSISFVVLAVIVICSVIEIILSASDFGLIATTRFRSFVYEYAGFWPGLLDSWQPNYRIQPYSMFLTYGFLHGGPMHLIVNMFTLWSIGQIVVQRVNAKGFLILYAGSILGGAVGFGLLAEDVNPMVGASGALFGLIGGLLAWSYIDRYSNQENLWPVGRSVLFLVALNLVLWWAMDGHLAWQTHLGGFLTGWVIALLIDPRPQE